MNKATPLTNDILLALQKEFPQVRLWRQNTGSGVPLNAIREACALIRSGQLKEAIAPLSRPVHFGVVGGADISGILGPHGVRLELEVKAGQDRQSAEQKAFAEMIAKHGGVYAVVRSVEDAVGVVGRAVAVLRVAEEMRA